MQNRIYDTAKHTLIYGIGNISSKIIGLLLLPLYTAKLSVLNYGKYAILEVTGQFLVMLVGLNLYSAMLRWCSEADSEENRKTIISTAFLALLAVIVLFCAVAMPGAPLLSRLYFETQDLTVYFIILFAGVAFEVINIIPLSILRFQEKSQLYIILVVGRLCLTLCLNIVFLSALNMGIRGIFLSNLIAHVVLFMISLPVLLKNINYRFNLPLFYEMIKYSIPLIFTSISVLLLSFGDRFIIKYYLPYSEVGIYSLAYKLAGVINVFVIQSFALGYLPIAYKMLNDPAAKTFYRKIFRYYSFVLIFTTLAISLFAREVLEIIARNEEYWIAGAIVPVLAITFVFKGIQYIFALGFHYVKQTKYNAYIVLSGVVINIMLNFLLIPVWGLWGAAITTLFSTLVITVLMYRFSQKKYFVSYEIKKFLLCLAAGICLFIFSFAGTDFNIIARISFKIILLCLFPLLLVLFRIIHKSEWQQMKKILQERRK